MTEKERYERRKGELMELSEKLRKCVEGEQEGETVRMHRGCAETLIAEAECLEARLVRAEGGCKRLIKIGKDLAAQGKAQAYEYAIHLIGEIRDGRDCDSAIEALDRQIKALSPMHLLSGSVDG